MISPGVVLAAVLGVAFLMFAPMAPAMLAFVLGWICGVFLALLILCAAVCWVYWEFIA